MPATQKKCAELLEKANTLPMCPGVYIMKDKHGKVIYVGKSKKLKNRVSQYFQNSEKNLKTLRMVNTAEDFDYILCDTEIEALSLENTLIKQHNPKYNIRLKDAKSYPYIKISAGEYPSIVMTRKREGDKGRYFGPYSGTSVVFSVIDILQKSLGIPSCKRKFPRDIGKERPCIYYQMKQCCGVCTGNVSRSDYATLIKLATEILRGDVGRAKAMILEKMNAYAEEEKFEMAAKMRDTVFALERLAQKQKVVSSPDADRDFFALYSDEVCSCISAMYVRGGAVVDKLDYTFGADTLIDSGSLASFICEHYRGRAFIPPMIYTSFELEDEDREAAEEYLSLQGERKVHLKHAQRGEMRTLCELVYTNAQEKAKQYRIESEKDEGVLAKLAHVLGLEVYPERIEAYDISNIGSEHVTAGMIVCENAKFKKSDYRTFKIKSIEGTDDYASMREAISRRFDHLDDEKGSFSAYPDLLLIDGGQTHVAAVNEVLREKGIDVKAIGMVKDSYHKTRALCTESEEISIAHEREIYMLIYKIQEEVHRYTVSRMDAAKRKTLTSSTLTRIKGIGDTKAKKLLSHFGSISALKAASEDEICAVKGVSRSDAAAIAEYFAKKKQ